jgi:diadenosine tetraphosphatase ApaH/serine/threonine PP2A family protein phosphatase
MFTEASRRLAVFSDIHGNLHALQAVLSVIDALGIDSMACLGDVVGYGAFPNECCDLLRERRVPTLAGNHDHATLEKTDVRFFNDIAKAAIQWTRERLTVENAQWLENLPHTLIQGDCLFVHATPQAPERWGYVLTFGDARQCFSCFSQRFCFIGHSHQPALVELQEDKLICPEGNLVEIRPDQRYLVNVGSVGQPRDHNADACFVTLDLNESMLQFHRVPYDIEAAQFAIRQAGLPDELADRLSHGW